MGYDTKSGEEGQDEANAPSNGASDAPPALRVIGAFGGIRPMASKLDVPVSTVQGWKERGVIPEARHSEVRAAAAAHAVSLDEADLAASAEAPPEVPADAVAAEAAAETATETAAEAAASDAEPAPAESSSFPPQLSESPIPAAAQQGGRHGWVSGFILGALVLAVGAVGAVLTKDMWAGGGATETAPAARLWRSK